MWRFNPFTGNLDQVGSNSDPEVNNFSYKTVALGVTVTIPLYQQMIVLGGITIDGTLNIDGELALEA